MVDAARVLIGLDGPGVDDALELGQVLDGLLLNPLLLLHKLTAEEDLYETLKACYEANG